jgi:predicted nucleic acid-binding protein
MIGIDTNVLVRFLVRDDEAQFDRARRLIKREASGGEPVMVSQLVLLEAEWVLRSRYSLKKGAIVAAPPATPRPFVTASRCPPPDPGCRATHLRRRAAPRIHSPYSRSAATVR